jgi:hypothetical protein
VGLGTGLPRHGDLGRTAAGTFTIGFFSAIGFALKRLKITVKKQFRYAQRDHWQRQVFLAQLRHLV